MLSVFVQAFKTPDLRKKLLFTLAIMALYRVGSHIPSPGVNYPNLQACLKNNEQNGLLDLVNLFSGGALLSLSVFAMGDYALYYGLNYYPADASGNSPLRRSAPGRASRKS